MNRSRIIAVVVILIIIAAAVVGWLYYQANPDEWDSFVDEMSGEPAQKSAPEPQRRSPSKEGLQASGAIEADEVVVSSPSGGLIMNIYADEGQRVSQGDLLLEIDDRAVLAQRKALSANLDQADAALQMAQTQLDSVKAGPRSEEIAAAEGAVQMATAQVAIANSGLAAIKAAMALGAEDTSPTEYDLETAEAQVDLAEGQLAQAQAQLVLVSTGATSYDIAQLEAQVAQAEAAKNAAQAALDGLDIEIEYLSISAPIDGVILQRLVNPGELAVPGGSLFLIADLQDLYLTVYVPEAQLGQVHLDQQTQIQVDAYEEVFNGSVMQIASEAEFTPRNVQTQEERVHMVFAVKIQLDNQDGRLKPGMPADALFISSG